MASEVSNATHASVWDGLLEVARVKYYYDGLERFLRYPVWTVRFLLAASGCGAFVAVIESWTWLVSASGVVVTVLVLIDLLSNGTARLAQVRAVNKNMTKLHGDYRALWEKVRSNAIDDHEALAEKRRLMKTMTRITEISDIGTIGMISQRAQEEAFKVEEQTYASG